MADARLWLCVAAALLAAADAAGQAEGNLGTILGHNRGNDVLAGDGPEYADSQHRARRSPNHDITALTSPVECRRSAIGKGDRLRVLRALGGVGRSGRPPGAARRHGLWTRVLHGKEAEPGDFPFLALLLADSSMLCGGALLSPGAVLTAAHCVHGYKEWVVQLGSVHMLVEQEGRQMIFGAKVATHPRYSSTAYHHDIAVVFLETPAVLNSIVQTVRLPTDMVGQDLVGRRGLVAGWGRTDPTNDCSQILLYAPLVVVSDENCAVYFPDYDKTTSFCAGGKWGASICNGDNGSPFIVDFPEGHVMVGVASFMFSELCLQDFPTGFTRVTAYLDWITKTARLT